MPNKYHRGDPEKPGVKHRRLQVEAAERELSETRRMMRTDPEARTGVVANRQQLQRAQTAYKRIRKATGY